MESSFIKLNVKLGESLSIQNQPVRIMLMDSIIITRISNSVPIFYFLLYIRYLYFLWWIFHIYHFIKQVFSIFRNKNLRSHQILSTTSYFCWYLGVYVRNFVLNLVMHIFNMYWLNCFGLYLIILTYSSNTMYTIGQQLNSTRYKRSVTAIKDKTFKKESVSTASFTKVGSPRLDYKTWPK